MTISHVAFLHLMGPFSHVDSTPVRRFLNPVAVVLARKAFKHVTRLHFERAIDLNSVRNAKGVFLSYPWSPVHLSRDFLFVAFSDNWSGVVMLDYWRDADERGAPLQIDDRYSY